MFYVSPGGLPGNDGSKEQPIDLATVFSNSTPARPGDSVWLRGGIYRGNFTSHLNGTADAPILVRQYPGERVTLDGALSPEHTTFTARGAYTWYWGFEVTNSAASRVTDVRGNPTIRGSVIEVFGPHVKAINLIVHDGINGIAGWAAASDAELYGNIIYNNGVEGPERGHGHSLYVQNERGAKDILDNILFNGSSYGIHAYTENGHLDNLRFEGNVAFNHGVLSKTSGVMPNYFLGGGDDPDYPVLRDNYSYLPNDNGRSLEIRPWCRNGTIVGNYFARGVASVFCQDTVVARNVFIGSFAAPRKYAENTYQDHVPAETRIFVRRNRYESGRAHIIVFNWKLDSRVALTLDQTGVRRGDAYEIRDVQNYFGRPVAEGTYQGETVELPMEGLVAVRPVGNIPVVPTHTSVEFGVFVVMKKTK